MRELKRAWWVAVCAVGLVSGCGEERGKGESPVSLGSRSQALECGGSESNARLVFLGPSRLLYSRPGTVRALLTDASGAALAQKPVSYDVAGAQGSATTDGQGVLTAPVPSGLSAGTYSASFSYSGELGPAQTTATLSVLPLATQARYTGPAVWALGEEKQAQATLSTLFGQPLANRAVVFQLAGSTAQGTTNAEGVAVASLQLSASASTGPQTMKVSFAGEGNFEAASAEEVLTAYAETGFVIWGGNTPSLQMAQNVTFWVSPRGSPS